jgi:O-antigen/teichoic acid export membrane protein
MDGAGEAGRTRPTDYPSLPSTTPEGTVLPVERERRHGWLRLLASAVLVQAVLSATNFAVGLILIRHTGDRDYGLYVLASTAIMLLTVLQSCFLGPAIAARLPGLDGSGRGALLGGLLRDQRSALRLGLLAAAAAAAAAFGAGLLDRQGAAFTAVALVAAAATLHKEVFRIALMNLKRPQDVLACDALYCALLLGGVGCAILTPLPALLAVLVLSGAALIERGALAAVLRRRQAWDERGAPGILREITPLASWSSLGAALHMGFTQSYTVVAAATLGVAAVAPLAATRLLLMPVNLLSTGVGSMMLPAASAWLLQHDDRAVLRRLAGVAAGLVLLATVYCGLMWLLRDVVFAQVLHKQIEHSDTLLLLWGALALVGAVRDQLVFLMVARGRFRALVANDTVCAVVAIAAGLAGVAHFGAAGAVVGILVGEILNTLGIAAMSWSLCRAQPRMR